MEENTDLVKDFNIPRPTPQKFKTKDSGKHQEFPTGMKRDTQDGKPRFDLMWIRGMPYEEQMLTRYARLRTRGAEKYCESIMVVNCELAQTEEEYYRFKASAARHFSQWMSDETDEDHMAAVIFNLQMAEMVKWKLNGNSKV